MFSVIYSFASVLLITYLLYKLFNTDYEVLEGWFKYFSLEMESSRVVRTALGRVGFIGELYDARTESFSSRSIFKAPIPPMFLQTIDSSNTVFEYKFTENYSERFELLNLEAELQVSLLCGLITVGGSGKFLSEEKKSKKNISCSLICKFQTVHEKLYTSYKQMLPYIDLEVLNDCQNTHFVSETSWGANCLLTLEKSFHCESQRKEIEGKLKSELEKLSALLKAKAGGKAQIDKNNDSNQGEVTIKVQADLVPDGDLPTTLEGFCSFIAEIPKLLKKSNNGKGKQLTYVMIPLCSLRKMAKLEVTSQIIVKSIDESFLVSIVCLFEEIADVKQKLYDLMKDFKENEAYIANEDIIKTKKYFEELKAREAQLKVIVGEGWVSIRSGNKNLRDLVKSIEKFKIQILKLIEFEECLENCKIHQSKIDKVKYYGYHGVDYLGRGRFLIDEQNKNVSFAYVVLLTCKQYESDNPELYQNTSHYFLKLAKETSPLTKYVVVDLDVGDLNKNYFLKLGITNVRCMLFKEGKIVSYNLYEEFLIEKQTSYARFMKPSEVENTQHLPGNRVLVEITCPGFKAGTCTSNKVKWSCYRCKHCLEYGFDNFFYCHCGKSSIDFFEFRCNNDNHGSHFLPAEKIFLQKELSILKPSKDLNILILGQSGVGKSTWINSIVNYLNYESLEKAKECGVICTIPISFTVYDTETSEKQEVFVGERQDEEVTEAGKSATQVCKTYSFRWDERYVRLIDTPGIGDTRGIEQDKKNIKNVIDHISYLKELHGVCILMKSNDCRMSSMFAYCIKELLIHMHKSVAKNIVFCFTNSRNSFYTPGQSSVILEKLIRNLNIEKELGLGHHNKFCLDNEAFLFLCTLQYTKIRYDENLVGSFAQSWDVSLKETKRLFNTIKNFGSHLLNDTVTLYTARNRILLLTKPVAEISKTIQINLSAIKQKQQDIETYTGTIEELSKSLYFDEVHLECHPLSYPMTVCTRSKCVTYHAHKSLNVTEIEYSTICHENCKVTGVAVRTVNDARLTKCVSMKNEYCTKCGCHYSYHMHISFQQVRVPKKGLNKIVEADMKKKKSDKEEKENFVKKLKEITEKYKKEQDIIVQISAKFGMFLKENAISIHNDALAEYLEHLINEEKNKPYKTEVDKNVLKNLEETLESYKAETAILQRALSLNGNEKEVPTPQQILEMEEKLYSLELTGSDIKKSVNASKTSCIQMSNYSETPLKVNPKKAKFKYSSFF